MSEDLTAELSEFKKIKLNYIIQNAILTAQTKYRLHKSIGSVLRRENLLVKKQPTVCFFHDL